MFHLSIRGASRLTTVVLGVAATLGTSLAVSAPVSAKPDRPVPKGVRVQCTGFYGPNTQWPHFLTGCTRRNGTTGSGQTVRTVPGSETITCNAPFVKGKSMQLTNIASSQVNPPTGGCPADHPAEVNVSGVIGADSKWAGSPVTATICGNATDFLLKPGAYFVTAKPSSAADVDDANHEP
jgi:hypothetical protein